MVACYCLERLATKAGFVTFSVNVDACLQT
jgi:hypothetical protein